LVPTPGRIATAISLHHARGRRQELGVGVQGTAVLNRIRAQPVPVADGDRPHPGTVERTGDGLDLVHAVLMGDRV
jgi:hypothetical protein